MVVVKQLLEELGASREDLGVRRFDLVTADHTAVFHRRAKDFM